MYANLDCRIERSNLFESICSLLSKTAFPVNSPLGSVHLHSLEGLFSILNALSKGCVAQIPRLLCLYAASGESIQVESGAQPSWCTIDPVAAIYALDASHQDAHEALRGAVLRCVVGWLMNDVGDADARA